jgi:hypothetical protein
MNANKRLCQVVVGLAVGAMSSMALAEQGVNASGQSKINNAKAKKWMTSDGGGNGYSNPVQQDRVVNFGSKKNGNCTVNVGTVQAGQKAPKEIVVTTREVINVCK